MISLLYGSFLPKTRFIAKMFSFHAITMNLPSAVWFWQAVSNMSAVSRCALVYGWMEILSVCYNMCSTAPIKKQYDASDVSVFVIELRTCIAHLSNFWVKAGQKERNIFRRQIFFFVDPFKIFCQFIVFLFVLQHNPKLFHYMFIKATR